VTVALQGLSIVLRLDGQLAHGSDGPQIPPARTDFPSRTKGGLVGRLGLVAAADVGVAYENNDLVARRSLEDDAKSARFSIAEVGIE